MKKSSRLTVILAVCVVGLLAAAMAGWALVPTEPEWLLPDGSRVRLVAVAAGEERRIVLGRPWQQALAPLIPPETASRWGWTQVDLRGIRGHLSIHVLRTASPSQRRVQFEQYLTAVAVDAAGAERPIEKQRIIAVPWMAPRIPGFATAPHRIRSLCAWDLDSSFRRDRHLRVRLYTLGPSLERQRVAEFTVADPYPAPPPSAHSGTSPP